MAFIPKGIFNFEKKQEMHRMSMLILRQWKFPASPEKVKFESQAIFKHKMTTFEFFTIRNFWQNRADLPHKNKQGKIQQIREI